MDRLAMQALIDQMSRDEQKKRSDTQLTLGKLINLLVGLDPQAYVIGLGELMSYRGYYSDLAFEPDDDPITVGSLLVRCSEAMGRHFEGYKGGEFLMGEHTPLWVSDYGTASGLKLLGLELVDGLYRPKIEEEVWE